MPIVYHIDRNLNLKNGQKIFLNKNYALEETFKNFNNSFSRHGALYLGNNISPILNTPLLRTRWKLYVGNSFRIYLFFKFS